MWLKNPERTTAQIQRIAVKIFEQASLAVTFI